MATESPIRLVEASEKWVSCKDAASFGQSSVAVESLGLPFEGKFQGDGRTVVPNRCESAPPSMEGSIAAIQNLMTQQNSILLAGLARPTNSNYDSQPENQKRADSAYLTYDSSFNKVKKRISPHVNSWEDDLIRGIGTLGSEWKVKSHDDFGKRSLQPNLATHKEEPEDDVSPKGIVGDQGERKNSIGLMESDIIFTQSPATDEPCMMSYGSLEEAVDHDADMREASCSAPPTASVSGSSSAGMGGASLRPSLYKRQSPTYDLSLVRNVSTTNGSDSDVARIEPAIQAVDICSSQNSNSNILKNCQQGSQNILPQQHTTLKLQGSQTEMASRVNYLYSGMPQFLHNSSASSATQGQPILQSSGYTPPLYTTATALMTSPAPFYPNMQLPGYFHPQFAAGGYGMNPTVHLPYLAGYSPYGAVPQAFQGTTSPATGVSGGGNATHAFDPLLDRFYGQLGLPMQPSLSDPLHMQYFQQPFRDAYSFSGRFDNLTPKDGASGSVIDLRKRAEAVTFMADQKVQLPESVGHSANLPRRGNNTSHYFLGSPTNIGPLMQFPPSPVASPVFPWSSGVGTSFGGGRNGMMVSSIASRNTGVYAARQGQGVENSACSLLEELKTGKGRRFDLSDIAGHIVEFSTDQHGSRFIQQKLENCSSEEKASVFKEILPQAAKLMTDVFGNYVIQKFFEYGTTEQRKDLADQLEGQVLPLSFQMYGCRVIQKALDVIQLEQKVKLVQELDGQVMRCVRDQNGNHVIQKCIESIPIDKIQFIISSFSGQVAQLSTHPYGCRVIQRVLEHCTDQLQSQFIVDEILESVCTLAQDQYGNYVTQHILEKGKPHERSRIIRKLSGRIIQLSQHKFASNVIEKCLEYGDSSSRELLIGEIIENSDGNDNLLVMMKDQYANYVVQKILRTCTDTQRQMLLSRIKDHINALKKYTYGKHIVARFEQLCGEAD